MRDFNRDTRGGRDRNYGRRDFDRGSSERPTMHKAICDKCGKTCEVPFRPTNGKPVFCSDCFRENGGPDARRSDTRDFRRPSYDNRNENRGRTFEQPQFREQLEALNVKLDKILRLLTPSQATQVTPKEKPLETLEIEKITGEIAPVKKKRASKKTLKATEE